jgi:hypothetical protein
MEFTVIPGTPWHPVPDMVIGVEAAEMVDKKAAWEWLLFYY